MKAERTSEETLILMRDMDNGYPYFVSILSRFEMDGRTYVALLPYEPDYGEHREPEFVIMRQLEGKFRGDMATVFESIRSRSELKAAYRMFESEFQSRLLQHD